MKKTSLKIVSILLSCFIVLSAFATTIFADDFTMNMSDRAELINEYTDGIQADDAEKNTSSEDDRYTDIEEDTEIHSFSSSAKNPGTLVEQQDLILHIYK